MEKVEITSLTGWMKWMDAQGIAADDPRRNMVFGKFLDNKARKAGVPMFGIFELTPLCNLDCRMCYVHLTPGQMGERKLLTGEQWIRLIDEAVELGMMNAEVTGGEAMLHPDFDAIYLHLQERGVRLSVMTNGILLDEKRIAFFKEHKPASIQVTLYGGSEEAYERVTGRRAYGLVTRHVVLAKEIGCRLVLSATPSRYFGREDVGQVLEFARSQELKLLVNKDLNFPREDTGRELSEFDLSSREYFEIMALIHGQEEFTGEIRHKEVPKPGESQTPWYGIRCGAGNSLFCINWEGKMKACLDLELVEDPLKEGVARAWEKLHQAVCQYEIPRECADCAYQKACNPCPVLHAMYAPKGHADRRICQRTMRLAQLGFLRWEDGADKT